MVTNTKEPAPAATDTSSTMKNEINSQHKDSILLKKSQVLNVLIACEESQRVCSAFRALGHSAYSCDIQEPSGGYPQWHIKGDVLPLLNGYCAFETMDGERHEIINEWDLIIAHPPCTYLSAAGAVRLFDSTHHIKDKKRYQKGIDASTFFNSILNADCEHIAVENPVPLKVFGLPSFNQIIQPYMFGDPWMKKTCLWLKGLPPLTPTNIVEPIGYWIGTHGRNKAKKGLIKGFRDKKTRSKTFKGIANAIAEQWSRAVLRGSDVDEIQHISVKAYRNYP